MSWYLYGCIADWEMHQPVIWDGASDLPPQAKILIQDTLPNSAWAVLCQKDCDVCLAASAENWVHFDSKQIWDKSRVLSWLDLLPTPSDTVPAPRPSENSTPAPEPENRPATAQAQIISPPQSAPDAKTLLNEIFKKTAWGVNKSRQEEIERYLAQAATLGKDTAKEAQRCIRQGQLANAKTDELKAIFEREGKQAAQDWLAALQKDQSIAWRVKHYIDFQLKKLIQYHQQRKAKRQSRTESHVIAPVVNAQNPHPNSLRHLRPSEKWQVVIDETGQEFEDIEDLNLSDHKLGRMVALAVPQGVELQTLNADFHAVTEKDAKLDGVINDILSKPVGVLGMSIKDPLSDSRPRWLSGVYHLLQLLLRLLPLPSEKSCQVDIFIEQRDMFDNSINSLPLTHLLMSELQSLDESRFGKLLLNIQFVPKGGHTYLPHVDALAHTWGGSSAKERLKRAQFNGHCFLNPQGDDLVRLYGALSDGETLSAPDWYAAACAIAHEPEHSLLVTALADLGAKCRLKAALWQQYLQEVQYRLSQKNYHPLELTAVLDWLEHYAPESHKLPPLLQLRHLTASIAAKNHTGQVLSAQIMEKVLDLSQRLKDEAAPEIAQAYARLAVSATNAYQFADARLIVDTALQMPLATVGRLNYGKLKSLQGQLFAFTHHYNEAEAAFTEAIDIFSKLSDTATAKGDIVQTQTYRLLARIDHQTDWQQIEPELINLLDSDLTQAAAQIARSRQESKRFLHHVFVRAISVYDEAKTLRQAYLNESAKWQSDNGHPWQLINLWRGYMAHFGGQKYPSSQAFTEALSDVGNGLTLQWIGLVSAILAETLGIKSHYPIEAYQQDLAKHMPPESIIALEKLKHAQPVQSEILPLLNQCLPFNFK